MCIRDSPCLEYTVVATEVYVCLTKQCCFGYVRKLNLGLWYRFFRCVSEKYVNFTVKYLIFNNAETKMFIQSTFTAQVSDSNNTLGRSICRSEFPVNQTRKANIEYHIDFKNTCQENTFNDITKFK